MRHISFVLLAAALGLLLPKWAAAFPRPDEITIRNVSAGGTGCPPHSVDIYVSATRPGGPADFFQVLYGGFQVSKGSGVPITEGRKACTISVDLLIPNGYRFTLADVSYQGNADIPIGSTGVMSTEYVFPFFSNRVTAKTVLKGLYQKDFDRTDTLALFSTIWSPCGRNVPLNMKSSLEVSGPASDSARMTVDLMNGLLTQVWAIQWSTC